MLPDDVEGQVLWRERSMLVSSARKIISPEDRRTLPYCVKAQVSLATTARECSGSRIRSIRVSGSHDITKSLSHVAPSVGSNIGST